MSKGGCWKSRRGQAVVWVAVFLPFFLAIVGLAIDGGVAFTARVSLQGIADGAARAGAMQVDLPTYRATGVVALDTGSARDVARDYVARQNPALAPQIDVAERTVTVRVHETVATSFLRIVGIQTMQVGATATAEAQHGIEAGS
jgi:Flp pilus assembly protein TadG